ncbi:hypothetical protein HK105_206807 [Polyrhizophydium stewartii]|uniref:Ribosomal protein S3 n=1 Tax=Polyrhizophydium stewartii TaxID=2732419 RepID=A0ABR4N282_9FUNG|nr:hypothetical protein HK105_005406 [Polyrhizophydium stewartii]
MSLAPPHAAYRKFLDALSRVARKAPPPAKLHNSHLIVPSPFHRAPVAESDPFLAPLRKRSEAYAARVASPPTTETVTDIPIPTSLMRHILRPVPPLEHGTSLGKILGFRIVVKGRRGTRTSKQVVSFGRMDTGATAALDGVFVDYGRSHYVNKKGSTGVKAWVTYSSK